MCFFAVLGGSFLFVGFFTLEADKVSVRIEQVEEVGAIGTGEY